MKKEEVGSFEASSKQTENAADTYQYLTNHTTSHKNAKGRGTSDEVPVNLTSDRFNENQLNFYPANHNTKVKIVNQRKPVLEAIRHLYNESRHKSIR